MKKQLLLLTFSVLTTLSWSQNNGNGNTNGNGIGNGNNQNYIYQNGNVGIGTTNPTVKLDVNGNMKVDSSMIVLDSLFVQNKIRVGNELKVEGGAKFQNVTINGVTTMPNLGYNPNPETFSILVTKTDGTVMRTGPSALFVLPPSIATDPNFCHPTSQYRNAPYWTSSFDKLTTLCDSVKVGIATLSPRVNLDVDGTTFSTRLFLGNADPLNTTAGLFYNLRAPYVDDNLDRDLFIIENMNRQLLSLNNNGLLRTREVRIDAESWADYVFQPSYTLLPLSEVAAYIAENGHLPDVPSEAEVKAEGINVAEMDALLLQKIEELTLYTIQLEERLKAMEQKSGN